MVVRPQLGSSIRPRTRDVALKPADPTEDLLEPASVVAAPLREGTPIPVDRTEHPSGETIRVSLATVMAATPFSA
jgi:hypothetical protein